MSDLEHARGAHVRRELDEDSGRAGAREAGAGRESQNTGRKGVLPGLLVIAALLAAVVVFMPLRGSPEEEDVEAWKDWDEVAKRLEQISPPPPPPEAATPEDVSLPRPGKIAVPLKR